MKFFNIFNLAKTTFYNNIFSGLTSENVQDAIDELDNKVGNLEGSDLGYSYTEDLDDPKTSNTVKKALDRIITKVDGGLF